MKAKTRHMYFNVFKYLLNRDTHSRGKTTTFRGAQRALDAALILSLIHI